jgi:hypothetical protein
MEKFPLSPQATSSKVATAGLEHELPQRTKADAQIKKAHAISQRALANLLKGARAGGFVPYEIVVGATGEVRLMAEPATSGRGSKPNDFDREFG